MCDFGPVISSLDFSIFIPQVRTRRFQRVMYRPNMIVDAKAVCISQYEFVLSHMHTHTHIGTHN